MVISALTKPSEDLSQSLLYANSKKEKIQWDINQNKKLDITEIQDFITKDLKTLQQEVNSSVMTESELKETKKNFMESFQQARYTNIRPDTWVNKTAMTKENFINKIQELKELTIDGKKIDTSKITDPYAWVKTLLSYLWYTGVNGKKLDITKTNAVLSQILPEQKDLYIALLNFQNANYWEANKTQSSYSAEWRDSTDDGKADGAIGGLTLRWLIQDALQKKNTETVKKDDTNIKENKISYSNTVQTIQSNTSQEILTHEDDGSVIQRNLDWTTTITRPDGTVEYRMWDRKLPKENEVYARGSKELFFTFDNVKKRGIKNIEYGKAMYDSLDLGSNLPNIEEAGKIREFVWTRLQQLDMAVTDLKNGVEVNGQTFKLKSDQIKQAIQRWTFLKSMKIGEKMYDLKFNLRTKQMRRAYDALVLWDKKWNLKEKYKIVPEGLIYDHTRGLFNDKVVTSIKILNSNRVLYEKI